MKKPRALLLVGSIPPPYHGQAVVTEMVFDADYGETNVEQLNLRFSDDLDAVGGFSLRKVKVLLFGVTALLGYRLRHLLSSPVLYYCAGSANWVPLIRDFILLGCFGKLFRTRVVHYHSGGLPEWFEKNKIAGCIGRLTYGGSKRSLGLTKSVKVPCYGLTQLCIVPNGLDISRESFDGVVANSASSNKGVTTFLYVGALRETKGVGLLLEVARLMNKRSLGRDWQMKLVGEWAEEAEKRKWLNFIDEHGLHEVVILTGRLTGEDKWQAYGDASVFVFPSYYESENQPLVVIEAMGMGLPVISSRWRGIPELLEEGKTGLLVEPYSVDELLHAMIYLIDEKSKMDEMSRCARERYNEHFTQRAFVNRLKSCLLEW